MIDYKAIEALYLTLELQSFEEAAKKLNITQPAISQRIKGLESYYGEPVLIRTQPYSPTRLGKQLISHFKRISLLEDELEKELTPQKGKPHISIALNRDSLETWFLDFLEENELFNKIVLEIVADDQELTLNYLKNGLVSACLSTTPKPITSGEVHFLGNMDYILAASPQFIRKHFSKENPHQSLMRAPAVKFDVHDKLHEKYLEEFFDLDGSEINFHIIPSVRGFKEFVLSGYGYALIPKIDIQTELKKKQLISIYNDKVLPVPLYWHNWSIQSKFYRSFNSNIIQYVGSRLRKGSL